MKIIVIFLLINTAFVCNIFCTNLEMFKEAVKNGIEDQVKQILKKQHDILLTDTTGPTALHLAVEKGNYKIVKKIIKNLNNKPAHEAYEYLSITTNDKSHYTAYQCANAKAQEIQDLKKQISSFDKELKTLQQQKQELLSSIKDISHKESLLKQSGNQEAFFSKQEEKAIDLLHNF